jgi:predicted secreted protein
MASGIVKTFPALIKPVVQFCLDHDINIMQMPCPETLCAAGGLPRVPHGKAWYEKQGLRATARQIAINQAQYMRKLVDTGTMVLAVVGVEFSPACAVNYLNQGRTIQRGEGIYVEELKAALLTNKLSIPFLGISQRWQRKMGRDLATLLQKTPSQGQKHV